MVMNNDDDDDVDEDDNNMMMKKKIQGCLKSFANVSAFGDKLCRISAR